MHTATARHAACVEVWQDSEGWGGFGGRLTVSCAVWGRAGAALELSTIMAPQAFLPLACSANLAKNLAAVAASSTRAPIYRTFALQNNLVCASLTHQQYRC